jgi:hypothetical protein
LSSAVPTAGWLPPILYGAVVLVGLFECAVLWQAVHPNVSALYRAYYIDLTTTCLNQPNSGSYVFGTEQSFRSGNEKAIEALRVCGWEGPAGDGLHAVGESSRLHFALPPRTGDLRLMLQLVAVNFSAPAGQLVEVVANGISLGLVHVVPGTPQDFSFAVPATLLTEARELDLELKYPHAILVSPQDPNTRKRSIKLTAVRVWPALTPAI